MKKTIIAILAHKPYDVPNEGIYLPLEVGAALHEKPAFPTRDNEGDNISEKNLSFCELTGIYFAYKNLEYDVLGFDHYRRYFLDRNCQRKMRKETLLREETIDRLLEDHDFILPKKRHYYIESNYSHYIHAHKREALDKTGEIISEVYPDYVPAFQKHMKARSGHYFNMFIGRKEVVKGYLDFMFDILFRLEKQINLDEYQGEDRRVFGFVSELLLDVYIQTNHLTFVDQRYAFTEKQNWFKKIFRFVARKFGGKR